MVSGDPTLGVIAFPSKLVGLVIVSLGKKLGCKVSYVFFLLATNNIVLFGRQYYHVGSKPITFKFSMVLLSPFRKPKHKITQLERFGMVVVLRPQCLIPLLLSCVFNCLKSSFL
jgi:hypothetical protein